MILNGVIAFILRYFIEFDRLEQGWLRHNIRSGASSSSYILAETDWRNSRTVSLRQLSFLFLFRQTVDTASYLPVLH